MDHVVALRVASVDFVVVPGQLENFVGNLNAVFLTGGLELEVVGGIRLKEVQVLLAGGDTELVSLRDFHAVLVVDTRVETEAEDLLLLVPNVDLLLVHEIVVHDSEAIIVQERYSVRNRQVLCLHHK